MKKLVYVTIALVALFAANSCKNKNNVPVISAADSVEVEDAMNDSTIYGVCGEGTSMHNLELISDDGDTLSVFIDDEDSQLLAFFKDCMAVSIDLLSCVRSWFMFIVYNLD